MRLWKLLPVGDGREGSKADGGSHGGAVTCNPFETWRSVYIYRKEIPTVKSNQTIAGFLTLCSVAILFVACANQMEPAKNVLDNIQVTLNSVAADAQKYVPEQYAQ